MSTVTQRRTKQPVAAAAPAPSPFSDTNLPTTKSAASRRPKLLTWEELPAWYQDNEHIRGSYRPPLPSAWSCLGSWLYMHNELINIHTHLLPSIALLAGLVFVLEPWLRERYADLTATDYGVLAFFLLTAATCFGLSAAYHTLICHSQAAETIWLRVDFAGIVLLILGSFISGIYVGFWCEDLQRKTYWGMIGTLGTISLVVMLSPQFQGREWRTFRLLTFVCTGLSGFAPIIHGIRMFGVSQMMVQSGLPYYLGEGGLFVLGAIVYGTRFPESVSPGTFDNYGASHQIFHVLVVCATLTHMRGVLQAFDYNYYNRQCAIS